jgi:hypothetical protein
MQLPSKLFSYEESVISKFPTLLFFIEKHPLQAKELYLKTERFFSTPTDFIEVLDILYALNKIEYDAENEVISYVD